MRSEEQRQREWQEEMNEPYIGGYTVGEFYALPERQRGIEYQKITRHAATYLGYFKTCTLPVCRRARACRGVISDAQYRQGGYQLCFPPCTGHGAPRHAEILAAFQMLVERAAERAENREQAQGRQDAG